MRKPALDPDTVFYCIHCNNQYPLGEKEKHAATHGYKEVPRLPRKKKPQQPTLPGILPESRWKFRTD